MTAMFFRFIKMVVSAILIILSVRFPGSIRLKKAKYKTNRGLRLANCEVKNYEKALETDTNRGWYLD